MTHKNQKKELPDLREKKLRYIDFDEFVRNSGVKVSTIKRRYKAIPGLTKDGEDFRVLSGTRYPYNIRNSKIDDYSAKRYTLLKAISKYQYISHKELRIEHKQFEKMLRDLLSAGLIQKNNLANHYGANAYDCTPLAEDLLRKKDKEAKNELIHTIAKTVGIFTGAVLSQVFNAA